MQKNISLLFFLLLTISTHYLQAQSFRGNRNNFTLTKEAPAPITGRELTMGGRLSPGRKIEHSIPISGIVNNILVNISDRVTAETNLIEIKRNVVGENYLPVYLTSRIYGVVSEISVYEKEEVKSGTVAVTIIDDRKAHLIAKVSDRDAWEIRALRGSKINGTSPNGLKISGILESVSEEPDYETGLFEVRMSFPRQENLYLGMLIFVDVSLGGNKGIPVEASALIKNSNKSGIWIINSENKFEFREVTNSSNGDKIFITDGLKQGEKYLVRPIGIEKYGLSMGEYMESLAAENNNKRSNN